MTDPRKSVANPVLPTPDPQRADLVDVTSDGVVKPVGRAAAHRLRAKPGAFRLIPSPPGLVFLKQLEPGHQRRVRVAGEVKGKGSLPDVAQWIANAGWKGELAVLEGLTTRSIFFDGGSVVGASSNALHERLGAIMTKAGMLTEEQVKVIVTAQRGGRFGERALGMGLIGRDDLFQVIRMQTMEIFCAAVLIEEGTYYFTDGVDEARIDARQSLSVQSIMVEAMRRIGDLRYFRGRVPSSDHIPFRVGGMSAGLDGHAEIHIPQDLRSVWNACDGRRSVHGIVGATSLPQFDVTHALYRLAEAGLVQLAPPTPQPEILLAIYNEAIRAIFMAVTSEDHRMALGDQLAAFAANLDSYGAAFDGPTPQSDGSFDPQQAMRVVVPLGTQRVEALSEWLYECAVFALFNVCSLIPKKDQEELVRSINEKIVFLQPKHGGVPSTRPARRAIAPDSVQAKSSRQGVPRPESKRVNETPSAGKTAPIEDDPNSRTYEDLPAVSSAAAVQITLVEQSGAWDPADIDLPVIPADLPAIAPQRSRAAKQTQMKIAPLPVEAVPPQSVTSPGMNVPSVTSPAMSVPSAPVAESDPALPAALFGTPSPPKPSSPPSSQRTTTPSSGSPMTVVLGAARPSNRPQPLAFTPSLPDLPPPPNDPFPSAPALPPAHDPFPPAAPSPNVSIAMAAPLPHVPIAMVAPSAHVAVADAIAPPPRKKGGSAILVGVFAVLGLAVVGGGVFIVIDRGLIPTPFKTRSTTETSTTSNVAKDDESSDPESPVPSADPRSTATAKPSAPSGDRSVASSATVSATVVSSVRASASASVSVSATPSAIVTPPVASSDSENGSIKTTTAAKGLRIFVDGRVVGNTPDPVTVKCGTRSIRIGSAGATQSIVVPCGGEIEVLSKW